MEMWAIFVDWEEASRRSVAGDLANDLVDKIDEESWLEEAEFDDTFFHFTNVGRAYEHLRTHAPTGISADLSASFDRFLCEEPKGWFDAPIELDEENHFLALSPATVAQMSAAMSRVDADELGRLYASHCPDDVRRELGDSPATFIEAIGAWGRLFDEATQRKWGLVVKVG